MARDGDLSVVIKQAFEEQGLSAGEIAEAFGLDAALVAAVLGASSAEYRTRRVLDGEDPEKVYEVVSDAEFEDLKTAYKLLMTDPDAGTPHSVRERGLRWLMEEKLGRNKKDQKLPGLTVNILRVNERLEGINARREKLLAALNSAANAAPAPAPAPLPTAA